MEELASQTALHLLVLAIQEQVGLSTTACSVQAQSVSKILSLHFIHCSLDPLKIFTLLKPCEESLSGETGLNHQFLSYHYHHL